MKAGRHMDPMKHYLQQGYLDKDDRHYKLIAEKCKRVEPVKNI